ncbi:hypothetical protein D3C86_727290 [compost metagenome]
MSLTIFWRSASLPTSPLSAICVPSIWSWPRWMSLSEGVISRCTLALQLAGMLTVFTTSILSITPLGP